MSPDDARTLKFTAAGVLCVLLAIGLYGTADRADRAYKAVAALQVRMNGLTTELEVLRTKALAGSTHRKTFHDRIEAVPLPEPVPVPGPLAPRPKPKEKKP